MSRRPTIYWLAGAGLTAMWLFLLFLPAHRQLTQLRNEVKAAQTQAEQLKSEVDLLPGILREHQLLTETELRLAAELYTDREILGLLDIMTQHCQKHSLEIAEVRPPVEELLAISRGAHDRSKPQFLNITLVVTGPYAGFGRFVTELERAPYYRGMNYSRISGSADGLQPTQYYLDFKVLLGRIRESLK